MANRKSAFAGIFEDKAPELTEPAPPPIAAKQPTKAIGKRSNPAYRQSCFLLRITTTDDAEDKLRKLNRAARNGSGEIRDMSDIVEELLERWAKE